MNPTGAQWTLAAGRDLLTVVEVGGGLRSWTRDGVDILAGYAAHETCTSGRGQQLIPWPNRTRDGRYEFDGTAYQLPITEVPLGNASHGLVRWSPWRLEARTPSSITVAHQLFAQPGWDWPLLCRSSYSLAAQGLTVRTKVTNAGATSAPFGYGAHPYLSIGDAELSAVELEIPGGQWVEVDERSLPVAVRSVADTGYDFRERRALGSASLDTAYTDLSGADGCWRVTVAAPGRQSVVLWGEAAAFPWVQVFTRKGERDQPGRHGIAVEPMTCPADAFNSGEGLLRLGPGETWTGTWGISPI